MFGFTLIELTIVVAVVAILSAIALPSFLDYLTRSRRADAMIALQHVANEQEQWYFDQNTYAATLGSVVPPNWCNPSCRSPDEYYDLAIVSASITNFTATAIPVSGGSQDGDGSFRINAAGVKGWDPAQDNTWPPGCDWDDANRGGGGGC